MKLKITNLVKFYTLLLLNESPKYGYEVMGELVTRVGKISPSQVYPFFAELEKKKLIEVVERGEREKKKYKLTKEGKDTFKEVYSKMDDLIENMISKKINICVHCDEKIYGQGHKEKIKGKQMIFCCKYCAASYKKGEVHKH